MTCLMFKHRQSHSVTHLNMRELNILLLMADHWGITETDGVDRTEQEVRYFNLLDIKQIYFMSWHKINQMYDLNQTPGVSEPLYSSVKWVLLPLVHHWDQVLWKLKLCCMQLLVFLFCCYKFSWTWFPWLKTPNIIKIYFHENDVRPSRELMLTLMLRTHFFWSDCVWGSLDVFLSSFSTS